MAWLQPVSDGVGAIGALIIVFGVVAGSWRFITTEWSLARGREVASERRRLRHSVAYYLLLGLEFLIAADIIDTLMKPTTQDLIVLGAIVAIRTVISLSLNAELKHEQASASEEHVLHKG
jgi:uncharacterized membrane protein